MNTNIVDYIIKNKELNQTDIAKRMQAIKRLGADEEKQGISQVVVSKWKRGGNIPKDREIELLKMADIYWKMETNIEYAEDPWEQEIEVVDSRWNVLVQSEKNQEDWYDLISEIVSPKKILNEQGEYESRYFSSFVRDCVLLLNEIEFVFPRSADLIKVDEFYFDLFYRWMRRTCQLQAWCSNSVPKPYQPVEGDQYCEVYNALYKVALAQTISETDIVVEVNRPNLAYFIEDTTKEVEQIISSWMFWAGQEGAPLWESEFDEILIKNDKSNADNKIKLKSLESEDFAYWSEAERKIYEGIKNNERLLKELLEKLNK
jgi:hypothetical protein